MRVPYYFTVQARIPGDAQQAAVVYKGRGHAQAGRIAADLVRYGLVAEARVVGWQNGWEAPNVGNAGAILLAAVAAHRAGVA